MKTNPSAEMSDSDPPGTVLRDVHTLLGMLRTDGIEAGAGSAPAMKALPHINARLAEPIQIDSKRAQLRSYPNIQALYLLLRTTGLLRLEQAGTAKKLVADVPNAEAFCSLNPTEQFGSMLDAWLTKAHLSAVGIERSWPHDFLSAALYCWRKISPAGAKSTPKERESSGAQFARELDRLSLWLLRGFGLIDLEQGRPIASKPWHPAVVRRSQFGLATVEALLQARGLPYRERMVLAGFRPGPRGQSFIDDLGSDTSEPPLAGLRDDVKFDTLQPALKPHWPAWRRSLALPPLPFRDGTFTFRVSAGKIWRRIAIPARKTLEDLGSAIIDSVDFDFDHLWEFKFSGRAGGEVSIVHPSMEGSSESHKGEAVLIGDLPLAQGESMSFCYDFGDNWQFDVTLEGVDAGARKLKTAKVIESHGKSPEQYGDWC